MIGEEGGFSDRIENCVDQTARYWRTSADIRGNKPGFVALILLSMFPVKLL